MKKICLVLALVLFLPFVLIGCGNEEKLNTYFIVANFNDEEKSLKCNEKVIYVNNSENALEEVCFFVYANGFDEGVKAVPTSYINRAYPNGESFGNLTFESVFVAGQEVEINLTESKNILTFDLLNTLYPNEVIEIDLNFTVNLANINHRLGYGNKACNFGNFFPIACVYENGFVKNEFSPNGDPFYSDVSNFKVEINCDKDYVVATTGDKIESISGQNKKVECTADKVRDFCFVLSKDFEVISGKAGDVDVFYYFYDDENAKQHLDIAVKSVNKFVKDFGSYPYKQLSVVKTNFCFGGMEYPNLVMISDDLADNETENYVIVHEIAHQWWYGIVGNNEFQNAWVDEGLTEFSTALFFKEFTEYGFDFDVVMDNATESYKHFVKIYSSIYESLDESMNRNLNEFATEPEYVNCTYTKGMLLFESLRQTLGEKKLLNCLKEYYKDYAFKNSSSEKLIESFSKTARINLESYIESWTNGTVVIK